jgi:hypothetical protein
MSDKKRPVIVIRLETIERSAGLWISIGRHDEQGALLLALLHVDTPIKFVRNLANSYAAQLGAELEDNLKVVSDAHGTEVIAISDADFETGTLRGNHERKI